MVRPAVPDLVHASTTPPEELQRRVRRGELVRVGRGSYVVPVAGLEPWAIDQQVLLSRAAALHHRRSGPHWFSHATAAVLWGCPPGTVPRTVDVTAPVRRRTTPGERDGAVREHYSPASDGDVCDVLALPTTSLERTAVDCAAVLPGSEGLAVADSALRAGADPAELDRVLGRRAGRPGVRRARAVLGMADPRAESVGESRLRWLLRTSGLPGPELQVPVRTAAGWRWLDLGWPDERVAVEFDGRLKYGRDGREAADAIFAEKRRQDAIEDEGWTVVRVTWRDLDRPAETVARIRRALRAAGRRRRR
ncbi:hypothetical protein [Cellulomonas sp. IC4_254]|uniref:hypothetical protein n=1 Tax=Cellulomonas sp. IC4_254 TaxID=2714040 RepID=UPI00141EAAB3|nr:hypothetical protein [Cellulomonas sp. IC4_254]NHT16446.1 hypothetical protein [Cellulomonas sp. IC4_254]